MKSELSSLDIHYLMQELQILIDAKIDKIFQDSKNTVFGLHLPGKGKQFLTICLPGLLFLHEKKDTSESTPFALSLRKKISGARIRSIQQIEFERIIILELETKENKFHLYIELFRPGNIILCNDQKEVIIASTYKGFGNRLIRPNIKYVHPQRDFNALTISHAKFKDLIETSDKDSIVVTLATQFGLGGLYAEEICDRANIDKKKSQINEKEMQSLFSVLIDIGNQKYEPTLYEKNWSPINLISKQNGTTKTSLSSILEHITEQSQPKKSQHHTIKSKWEGVLRQQEAQMKGFEQAYDENQKKGEFIYEKYPQLQDIHQEIVKAKKKYSMQEIQKKLKNHPVIKSVNIKENTITIDLE